MMTTNERLIISPVENGIIIVRERYDEEKGQWVNPKLFVYQDPSVVIEVVQEALEPTRRRNGT
jgi:hypothetical protein